MANATKTVNYTTEQESAMTADYKAGVSLQIIADGLGKSVRSVTAKLSRLGVYKPKAKEKAEGAQGQKKSEVAAAIGAVLLMSQAEIDSLSGCTKTVLEKLWKMICESQPVSA